MNIINLFKNKLDRILTRKEIIIIATVIVPIMIVVAVLFSEKTQTKETFALVSNDVQQTPKDRRFEIEVMNKKPVASELLLGKYDAIVEEKNDGDYKVTTLKSESDKKIIENFFKFGKIPDSYKSEDDIMIERGVGTNILGFTLMVLLMQGVALTTLYSEDRTLKTFRRILTAPVSEKQYLFVQGIFTFLCLYIPSYVAIIIAKVCLDIKVGFSSVMLALLLAILTALSTALALFITSVLEQNITLVASGIYVITCVLSGSFHSFTENGKIFDNIFSILPQKAYMTLVQGVEKGSSMIEFKGQLIYLSAWIVIPWLLGSSITIRKMRKGIY